MTLIKVILTNGETVKSKIDANNVQEVINTVFGGEFFVEDNDEQVEIIPRDKIMKVLVRRHKRGY